jgi:hypothetical protein
MERKQLTMTLTQTIDSVTRADDSRNFREYVMIIDGQQIFGAALNSSASKKAWRPAAMTSLMTSLLIRRDRASSRNPSGRFAMSRQRSGGKGCAGYCKHDIELARSGPIAQSPPKSSTTAASSGIANISATISALVFV